MGSIETAISEDKRDIYDFLSSLQVGDIAFYLSFGWLFKQAVHMLCSL